MAIDEIIDAEEEAKNIGEKDRLFVSELKNLQPGDAAEKLVSQLINSSQLYHDSQFVKYAVGMTMAYLNQYPKQPEREWRCRLLRYEVGSRTTQHMPPKLKDAFELIN